MCVLKMPTKIISDSLRIQKYLLNCVPDIVYKPIVYPSNLVKTTSSPRHVHIIRNHLSVLLNTRPFTGKSLLLQFYGSTSKRTITTVLLLFKILFRHGPGSQSKQLGFSHLISKQFPPFSRKKPGHINRLVQER